jgi:RNA polymerase sigma-70 factor (ECF subfamily)
MDTELVIQAQRGDKRAFAAIAAAVADQFLAVSRRILRDLVLAEDATQQALLSIWQDLPQLRDPARFDAWSYRLLVRACYAEASRSRRSRFGVHVLEIENQHGVNELDAVVDRDVLERAFQRLPIDQRTVVVLRHYLDLPADEVADTLGVPVGTVHSRLHYAIRALRAAIDADTRLAPEVAVR